MLVYAPGCWDVLHYGHINFLEAAKNLGDKLIVGVPSDDVVREDKGSFPLISCEYRLRSLQALRCVDVVATYHKLEFLTHLEMFRPDVLAVGETWGKEHRHFDAERWMKQHGGRLVVLPYTEGISSTKIKERYGEQV